MGTRTLALPRLACDPELRRRRTAKARGPHEIAHARDLPLRDAQSDQGGIYSVAKRKDPSARNPLADDRFLVGLQSSTEVVEHDKGNFGRGISALPPRHHLRSQIIRADPGRPQTQTSQRRTQPQPVKNGNVQFIALVEEQGRPGRQSPSIRAPTRRWLPQHRI